MADIFDEVEDGLRQDKLYKAWRKYGIFAYIAAGLLVAGVAYYEFAGTQREKTTEENVMVFEDGLNALADKNYAEAETILAPMAASDKSIAPVAAQYLAAVRLEGGGDVAGAIRALEEVAGTDGPTEKLALIKLAYLKADTTSRADLETLMGDLRDEESSFGALALELLAAEAAAEGDIAYARQTYNELRFLANVPPGVLRRAEIAVAALPVTAEAEPDAPDATTETTTEDAAPTPSLTDEETAQ